MGNHIMSKMKHNKDVQGTMLGEWARNTFNMTAECESVDGIPDESKYSPCKTRLSQVQSLEIDQQLLCNFCQIHECNGFCLRSVKIFDNGFGFFVSLFSIFGC